MKKITKITKIKNCFMCPYCQVKLSCSAFQGGRAYCHKRVYGKIICEVKNKEKLDCRRYDLRFNSEENKYPTKFYEESFRIRDLNEEYIEKEINKIIKKTIPEWCPLENL